MKVLLLIDAMPLGGAERQMSYLAIGLKKAGHRVRLVTFFDLDNGYFKDLLKEDIHTEVYEKGKNPLIRAFVIRSIVNNFKPDMTVAYKFGTTVAACMAQCLGKRFNLVVSERNTTQQLTAKEKLKFVLYRLATYIVPNSFTQAKFIEKHYPNLLSKIRVITNMVDTQKFRPPLERPKNPIPVVLTTARVSPQKNITNYIKAIKIIKDKGIKARFEWYGYRSSDNYLEEIKKLASELNVEEMISFNDSVNNVVELYHKADIFCLPSLFEGFPNVLCESMSCGLISLASNICDNMVIQMDTNFLFDPKDPNDIADKIENAIYFPEDLKRNIMEKNVHRIYSLCSESVFLDKYAKLCNINTSTSASTKLKFMSLFA